MRGLLLLSGFEVLSKMSGKRGAASHTWPREIRLVAERIDYGLDFLFLYPTFRIAHSRLDNWWLVS